MQQIKYENKRDRLIALMASCSSTMSKQFIKTAIELAELYRIYNNET